MCIVDRKTGFRLVIFFLSFGSEENCYNCIFQAHKQTKKTCKNKNDAAFLPQHISTSVNNLEEN